MSSNKTTMTIFYDSQCPLCLAEMRKLKEYDKHSQFIFINLHDEDFSELYPHINKERAYNILHGQLSSGELLLGLDATYKAWSMVGKHRWLAILRWPLIRNIADIFYHLFARYRTSVSYILTGKSRCSSCSIKN